MSNKHEVVIDYADDKDAVYITRGTYQFDSMDETLAFRAGLKAMEKHDRFTTVSDPFCALTADYGAVEERVLAGLVVREHVPDAECDKSVENVFGKGSGIDYAVCVETEPGKAEDLRCWPHPNLSYILNLHGVNDDWCIVRMETGRDPSIIYRWRTDRWVLDLIT